MTLVQREALRWLRERNGTGVFAKDGVVIAAGERAPTMRSTWNALRDTGAITIEGRRLTVAEIPPGEKAP